MDDLMDWLRAQIDEDDRDARAAAGLQADPEEGWGIDGAAIVPHIGVVHEEEARQHIARHDPARVLAEVDAKRRILDDLTARRLDPAEPQGGWEAADAETDGMASSVVRLLALPYADRPGYREEWRP